MIRETSIESYHKIKDEGLLSTRRLQVYEVLFHHGPLTAGELSEKLPKKLSRTIGSNVHARLSELAKQGVVKEIGLTFCTVSGMKVIQWDCTKNLPVKLEKPIEHTCQHCNGTGKIKTQQTRMF